VKSINADSVLIVTEEVCQQVVGRGDAFTAVENVFAAMARGDARNFPVVREALGHSQALYGFKSGFDRSALILGVKAGGYWPENASRGLTNHQSSILLFDPDTGRLRAIVGGNYLTAVRTAAASAVSITHLARTDAEVLGILGAGHQSAFQLRAAAEQRDFKKIIAWNKTADRLSGLRAAAEYIGLPFEAMDREDLCAEADVIITMTASHEALIMKDWVKPGTHLACMGADTAGKQEVDPKLAAGASLFTDDVSQSSTIGEIQHAKLQGLIGSDDITPIGEVINGAHPGRRNDSEITLFDGTGVGLQDLAVANAAMERAIAEGKVQIISL